MHIRSGIICCNPHRAKAGLGCDADAQLACASVELGRLAQGDPDRVPALLDAVLPLFPVDMLRERARQAGHLDTFIDCAARYCAALSTRTERRLFWALIAGTLDDEGQIVPIHVTTGQVRRFERLMGEAWARLRQPSTMETK
ncbi:hypothetical protein PQR14_23260 [Paraburkholderia bryophila]|uniref:hypothetical protein n=1 Tax=Paraburkholderia bryophila TaxID=420952 RepID=UPI0038BCC746